MHILPPPNHRGPRLLLAGILSVGVHAAALGLAGVFLSVSPPAVGSEPTSREVDDGPEDPGIPFAGVLDSGIQLPEPNVLEEIPANPVEVTLEEDPLPPPPSASTVFYEPTPVPRPSVQNRPSTARTVSSVRNVNPGNRAGAVPGGQGSTPGDGPGTGLAGGTSPWVTPKPPYPDLAKRMRQTGSGSVRIQTDAGGRVIRAEMVQPISPALDATTLNFARTRWSGPPNRTIVIPLTFELR